MRAVILDAPREIRLADVKAPDAKADHVIVHVEAVGVCGSDLPRMLIKGAHKMPLICGHEFCGKITQIGEGVSGFEVDELVAIAPMIPCQECDQCKQGQFSRCRDYDYFGSRRDGAYAEYVSIPKENLLKVAKGTDPRAVAMVDPASIALHAIWKAGGVKAGQRGAVIGAGPIGLFAIQWMKIMGASQVVAVDISQEKLELAKQAGATHTFLADDIIPNELLADVLIEAVGHPSAINSVINLAAPGGHVAFIGIPVGDVNLSNSTFQHFLRQEISLHGSWNSFGAPYPGAQWTVTLEKFGTGELKWEFMISHQLTLEELPKIFKELEENKKLFYSKIMFIP